MLITRTCEVCGIEFEATQAVARYCRPAHRNKAYRDRRQARESGGSGPGSGETSGSEQAGEGSSVQAALLTELRAVQADGTAMGQALLTVARRIDHSSGEPGSALASLVLRLGVELERTVGRLPAPGAAAAVDEVARAREQRDRKRGSR